MVAKKASRSKKPARSAPPPTIHEATCAMDGSGTVYRGIRIDEPAAVARRKAGGDVVVCGDDVAANAKLARTLEAQVSPRYTQEAPHTATAGPNALPHFQPDSRSPAGHTFYEGATQPRKAKKP